MTALAAPNAGAWAAMVASAALWGLGTVLTKGVVAAVPPFTLLALQLAASVAALGLLVALAGEGRPALRRGWAGLLEPGLAYAAGVPGVMLTTAGAASLIAASEPAFTLLVAWVLLGQRPGARLLLAMAVAMAGVALVGGGGGGGERSLAGDLLVLAGTAAAAFYVVLSSRQVASASPLALAVAQHAWGLALALVLLAAVLARGGEPARLPAPGALALALLSGVVQYALPFWLYLTAIRSIPVGRAALALTLTPVFGVGGGMVALGESLAPPQALGAALILLALLGLRGGRR